MKHRPGYTLLELVISMTVMVVIFTVVSIAVINVLRENRARNAQIDATNQAMNIVRSLTSIIRETQYSPTGAYPIVAANDTSITFFAPLGGGSTIQHIRLFKNGTTLQQGVIQPVGSPVTYPTNQEVVSTLMTGVRNSGSQPLFQYYNKNYTGSQAAMSPVSIVDIRLIKISVIYDKDPAQSPAANTIELQAQLRNVKDNF